MPRTPRLDHPGARHHVMNRGAHQQTIFHDDEERALFLHLLSILPARFGIVVVAYCLMTNHFHLLLIATRGNLSAAMQFLLGTFVRRVNAHQEWDGPLFRGRFTNRLVTTEAYWRYLPAYIHLNPLDAGLIVDIDQPAWTSHRAYAGLEPTPHWLSTREMLDGYGSRTAYRDYLGEVLGGRELPPAEHTASGFTDIPEPLAPLAALPASRALHEVCSVVGLRPVDLKGPRRKIGEFSAWALYSSGSYTQEEIARTLGVGRTAVTQRIQRFEQRVDEDADFARWHRLWVARTRNS